MDDSILFMRLWHRLRGFLLRRPTLVLNAVLAVLVLVGAGWAYITVYPSKPAAATSSGTQRIVAVSQGAVTSTVSASGSVASANVANATFVTSGTVTEIDVKVGDVVKKGQLLAKVGPAAAQGQLDNALANLNSAQQSLTRAQTAATPDAATVASAQAQVTLAQTNVATAQRAVDGVVLTAPMDGTVITVNGTVGGSSTGSSSSTGSGTSGGGTGTGSTGGGATGGGATGGGATGGGATSGGSSGSSSSASGSGFVQIADLSRMQVSTYIAEADATKLKVGQAATITWSALANARVSGKVATISPTASTQNGVNSYAVTVSLDSLPDGVRIGQTTTVTIAIASADNVVRVPVAAVRNVGSNRVVGVVSGGTTQPRTVRVGIVGDQYIEITSGLEVGEQVAIVIQAGTNGPGGAGTRGGGGVTGGGGFNGGGGVTGGGGVNGGNNRRGTG